MTLDATIGACVHGAGATATPVELIRALAVFAEPPGPEHIGLAAALGIQAPPLSSDYSDIFLFQLYPYASVHLGAEGMMGGEASRRVAGFWSALGRTPPPEPDHLSALLGLYAALSEEVGAGVGSAGFRGRSASETTLIAESRDALLHEHLAPWVPAYLERVVEIASGAYREWAELLSQVLRDELERAGTSPRLPLHLREAPPLADPRVDGADAFLSGLLTPVRAGMFLTRADLARVAATLDLGLRAGERRYALDHLLGQDAERVLDALAQEAARQAAGHEGRRALLGVTAEFLLARAHRTAALLRELAREAEASAGTGTGVSP